MNTSIKQRLVAIGATILLSGSILLTSAGCAKKDADMADNGPGYYTGPAKSKGTATGATAGKSKSGLATE